MHRLQNEPVYLERFESAKDFLESLVRPLLQPALWIAFTPVFLYHGISNLISCVKTLAEGDYKKSRRHFVNSMICLGLFLITPVGIIVDTLKAIVSLVLRSAITLKDIVSIGLGSDTTKPQDRRERSQPRQGFFTKNASNTNNPPIYPASEYQAVNQQF